MRRLAIAIAVFCICGITVNFALRTDRAGVTRANFDRIQKDMTFEQVSDLFDGHPNNMAGRPWAYCAVWRREDMATAEVCFRHGLVVEKEWTNSTQGILEEICRRIFHR